jgi:hypothetical protein
MSTDGLQRRSRFSRKPQPQPRREAIALTDRDDAIFQLIDRHGKLPSNYLYEFTKEHAKHFRYFQDRLTLLTNGVCTHADHFTANDDGHVCRPLTYLSRDRAQFLNKDARYQPAIYGLTPEGKRRLEALGKASISPERNDPFVHQFMGACFSASLEFEASKHDLRFIGRGEILRHPKCPPATRTLPNPYALPVHDTDIKHLIPDNLFALKYPHPDANKGYRFFAVEIDRNTESIYSRRNINNTIARKVRAYENILTHRTHQSHLGIPNLTVLFVTTNDQHLENMLDCVRETARNPDQYLFKAFPTFGEDWRVPREVLPVFEPWMSARGSVDISKKAPA